MKEAVGRVNNDPDFVLPRACKRARSCVTHSKNPSWELSKRPRRAVVAAAKIHCVPEISISADDSEDDLGEVALALLEMSSPRERQLTRPTSATSLGKSHLSRGYSASPNALHLQSNTLRAVPTIIITSGPSTESGTGDSKSGSSDANEGGNSTGQTASPISQRESETLAYVHHCDSSRPATLGHSLSAFSCAASKPDPRQGLEAASALDPMSSYPLPKIGYTVSTGISAPPVAQKANKQVKQEILVKQEQLGPMSLASEPPSEGPHPYSQLILQQALHNRLAAKHAQAGVIANTRGGKLIVTAPSPKHSAAVAHRKSSGQLVVEEAVLGRSQTPPGLSRPHGDAQPLTLSRAPTLVLSAAHKPSKLRAATPETIPWPLTPHPQTLVKKEASPMPTAQVQPLLAAAVERQVSDSAGNKSNVPAGPSTSSGEESSEEDWLPNWSLNLYNALNPTVITTGQSFPISRAASHPLDSKSAPSGQC